MSVIKNIYKEKYQGPIVNFKDNNDESGFISAGTYSGFDSMEISVFGNEDRIILTKQKSEDAGDYTEFVDANGEVKIAFGTGFEFMYNDKLIAQDIYGLKFFSIYYNKEKQAFDKLYNELFL